MVKNRKDSIIEIWNIDYINNPNCRRSYEILQIEPADINGEKFIVEVMEVKEEGKVKIGYR